MSDFTTPLKRCHKCGMDYPATSQYFRFRRGYLSSPCKKCLNVSKIASAKRNHAHVAEYKRQWAKNNPDKIKASYAKHDPEIARLKSSAWYAANRERALARERAKYRSDPVHRARKRATPAVYGKMHKSPARRAILLRYRARKRSLPDTFTTEQWSSCLNYWRDCCAYCGSQQGFWNPITADHYTPLNDPTCPGTVASNMLPACKSCNSAKRDRDPVDWLKESKKDWSAVTARIAAYFATL